MRTVIRRLAAGVLFVALCAAQTRVERLETRTNQDEKETGQAGGNQLGQYTNLADLRCQRPEDALVGLRVSRGSALDSVQVLCAPVRCAGTSCNWTNAYWGQMAGNLAGGVSQKATVCPTTQAVSGYKATVRNIAFFDYITDIEIQCATIKGPSRGRAHRTFPIGPPYSWLHSEGGLSESRGAFKGPFTCDSFSATAVSTATGRYQGLARIRVVQALSMYCGWPGTESKTSRCPPQTLYLGNNSKGEPICQPCVAATFSYNPVTGPIDRTMSSVPVDRFNCHYYTLTYLNITAGRRVRMPNLYERERGLGAELPVSQECLTNQDLQAAGFQLVQSGTVNPAALRAGDVVTVQATGVNSVQCGYAHSAVVIQPGTAASSAMLRQKPNPDDCIVDYSWGNFAVLYQLNQSRAFVWRRSGSSSRP